MIEKVLALYKKAGETPLECLDRFRGDNPQYEEVALSYVGRLDPLAEGVLLVVAGDENKNRLAYLGLPKEYEVDILFGAETDTGDPLGIVKNISFPLKNPEAEVRSALPDFLGSYLEPYPAFSSRTVQGKPLHAWAKEGRLGDIEIPLHKVTIFTLDYVESRTLTKAGLLSEVSQRIQSVHGDFRQEECLASWHTALKNVDNTAAVYIVKIRAEVGSGAYMRILAQNIGKKLLLPALAFHIKRISVGQYTVKS